jgi:hypothetical protein
VVSALVILTLMAIAAILTAVTAGVHLTAAKALGRLGDRLRWPLVTRARHNAMTAIPMPVYRTEERKIEKLQVATRISDVDLALSYEKPEVVRERAKRQITDQLLNAVQPLITIKEWRRVESMHAVEMVASLYVAVDK